MGPLLPSRMACAIYDGMDLVMTELFGVRNNGYFYKATEHPLMDDLARLLETYSQLPAKIHLQRTQRDRPEVFSPFDFDPINISVSGLMWEIDWLIQEACEIDDLEWKGTVPDSTANDNNPCRDKSLTSGHMDEGSWFEFEIQMTQSMAYGSTSLLNGTSRNIGLGLKHLTGGRVRAADGAEGHVLGTRIVLKSLSLFLQPTSKIRRELTTTTANLTTALAAVAQQRLRMAAVVRHVQGHPTPVMLGTEWTKSTIASNKEILGGAVNAVWGLENLDPALADVQHALQTAVDTMHETLIPGFAGLERDVEALRRSSKIPGFRFEGPYGSARVDVVERELGVYGIWVQQGPVGLLRRAGIRVFFLPPVAKVLVMLQDMDTKKLQVDRAVKAQYEKESEVFKEWKSERFEFGPWLRGGSGH